MSTSRFLAGFATLTILGAIVLPTSMAAEPAAKDAPAGQSANQPTTVLWWRQPVVDADTEKLVLLLLPEEDIEVDSTELVGANAYQLDQLKAEATDAALKYGPTSLQTITRYEVAIARVRDAARMSVHATAVEARNRSVQELKGVAAKIGLDEYELSRRLFVRGYEDLCKPKRMLVDVDERIGSDPEMLVWQCNQMGIKLGIPIPSLCKLVEERIGPDAEMLVPARLLYLWSIGTDTASIKDVASLNAAYLTAVAFMKATYAEHFGLTVEEYERDRKAIIKACLDEKQESIKKTAEQLSSTDSAAKEVSEGPLTSAGKDALASDASTAQGTPADTGMSAAPEPTDATGAATKNTLNAGDWNPATFGIFAGKKLTGGTARAVEPIVLARGTEYALVVSLRPWIVDMVKNAGGDDAGVDEVCARPLTLATATFKTELKSTEPLEGSFVLVDPSNTKPTLGTPFLLQIKVPKNHAAETGSLRVEVPFDSPGVKPNAAAWFTLKVTVK